MDEKVVGHWTKIEVNDPNSMQLFILLAKQHAIKMKLN